MLTVYLVDGTIRIILPGSQWAKGVLSWWAEHGISAVSTGEDPDTLKAE